MYKNISTYKIFYSDVDVYDRLKLSSLLGYMQESAAKSAEELGFGYSHITPKNLAFILSNSYVKIDRPINLGEELVVHTWPIKPKNFIIFRDFEFYVDGVKVGVATTRWAIVDLKDNFRLLPSCVIFEDGNREELSTVRSVNFNNWKIPDLPSSYHYSRNIYYSDCDHYFHANNTKYADYVIDAFDDDFLKRRFINEFLIAYKKQCKCGELLDVARIDNLDRYVIAGKVDEDLRFQATLIFKEI